MTLQGSLQAVIEGRDLPEAEAHVAMTELMSGQASPELIAGFLAALRVKGETIDEITGFARAMREASVHIRPRVPGRLIDTCSTGGAAVKTFNLGTTAAFVAAAGGAYVAKHGNRSFNRPCGSADLLEALGANLAASPADVQRSVETVGVGFLFAPNFHPAMKHAAGPRKQLGIRTVFNILGPLTNPASAAGQVLGVYDPGLVEPLAHVLKNLGLEHALVVHADGSDEPSLHVPTHVAEVKHGAIRSYDLDPRELDLPDHTPDAYGPLPPPQAAAEARRILGGADGPRASAVSFNAALALYVAGCAPSVPEGLRRAREILASKAALQKLDEFVASTKVRGAAAR